MRIGLIASPRQSIDEPYAGGMEAHTAQLARALRDRGHEVTIHAAVSDRETGVEPMCVDGKPLRLTDTAREDPSMCSEGFLQEHHAYLSLMLRLDSLGYDVAHNNALHYLPVAMAAAVSTPVISTLHTPPTPWLESAIRARPDPAAPRWISVSHANASRWDLGAGCEIIHNGVDVGRWTFSGSPEPGTAVWTGRLVPEKGPHLAIDAAARAGRRIVLAGPVGDSEYFAREILPRLGECAEYAGHLDTDALAQLVGASEVALVTPRWDEPFGLVAIESLACGTPVAAFSRGALPEILEGSCGALCEADDTEALAVAMDVAATRRRRDCRRRAVRDFSLARMVSRYENAYARAAAA